MSTEPVTFRPAAEADLDEVAEVYLGARAAAYPSIPRGPHPPAEVRAWVAGWDLTEIDVWIAEGEDGSVVGFARLDGDWLHSLYVAPGATGQGIGTGLLEVAKAVRPGGFGLWVFESNRAARDFYEHRGLTPREHTDGSANEEQAPDVEMVWAGSTEPCR